MWREHRACAVLLLQRRDAREGTAAQVERVMAVRPAAALRRRSLTETAIMVLTHVAHVQRRNHRPHTSRSIGTDPVRRRRRLQSGLRYARICETRL